MAAPFFYIDNFDVHSKIITLDEATSKHIVQVLRMQNGELLNLTDGNGHKMTCTIQENHKKHCVVNVDAVKFTANPIHANIAIAPVKNNSRFEWFLEKATEIGINNIYPIITKRTEKNSFKFERFQTILVSAMLQSQQVWLPRLHTPMPFLQFITLDAIQSFDKYVAHCVDEEKERISASSNNKIVLIGPEGDFTVEEIHEALEKGFKPLTLGDTRLRTETAAMVATVLLNQI